MLKTSFAIAAAAAVLWAAPAVTAWSAASASSAAQRSGQSSPSPMVHFEGCLFTESALTAKMPIVVPVGTTEGWVLTHVKALAGEIKDDEASRTTYTLGKMPPELGRQFYGKRVGVTGRVSGGTPRPTLNIVDVREISGGCPVLPNLP
jgi:hypothetical protein